MGSGSLDATVDGAEADDDGSTTVLADDSIALPFALLLCGEGAVSLIGMTGECGGELVTGTPAESRGLLFDVFGVGAVAVGGVGTNVAATAESVEVSVEATGEEYGLALLDDAASLDLTSL